MIFTSSPKTEKSVLDCSTNTKQKLEHKKRNEKSVQRK